MIKRLDFVQKQSFLILILTLEHTGCGNSISKPQFLIHKGKDKSDRIWPPIDPSDIILIEASGEVSWEAEHHKEDSEPGDRSGLNLNFDIYYVTLDKFLDLSKPEFPQL